MEYVSVTRALQPYYLEPSEAPINRFLIDAQIRGTYVHNVTLGSIARGLWYPDPPVEYRGYIDSFRVWFDNLVKEVHLVEEEIVDDDLGIVGHPDLICTMVEEILTLTDVKTPRSKHRLWAGQMAGYWHLAKLKGFDVKRIGTLRLNPYGLPPIFDSYPMEDIPRDFAALQAAVLAYRHFGKGE